MIRLIVPTAVALVAHAVGLIVAAWVLDDIELDAAGFVIAVVVFTARERHHVEARQRHSPRGGLS